MTQKISYHDRPDGKQFLLLGMCVLMLFTAFLGLRPLGVPSEARYAEIPREMVETGDWVTPRLNGVKYFEKPALYYWMQATALTVFGNNEFGVRISSVLLGVIGCLATYLAGCTLYGRNTAILGALMLAVSPVYFAISRIALTDMAVSTFLVTCLFFFIAAVDLPEGRKRRLLFYGSYVSAAFAVLSKGLIGLVVPGAIVFFWLVFTRRWSLLKTFYIPSGLLIFFAIATPWHVMAGQRTPEFWWFYFVHEHFLRYTTMTSRRWEPTWFFIPIILLGFVYWLPFMVASLKQVAVRTYKDARLNPRDLFMWIAIAFPFVFFSASKSKLAPYILPVFPFIALIAANWMIEVYENQRDRFFKYVRWGIGISALLAVALWVATVAPRFIHAFDTDDVRALAHILPYGGGFFAALLVVQLVAYSRRNSVATLALMMLASASFCLWGDYIAANAQFKSVKSLAATLRPMLKEDDVVACYWQYNQDLPFYLERTVSPVAWEGELEFGKSLEPRTKEWMLTEQAFEDLWYSDRQVYTFVRWRMLPKFDRDVGTDYRIVAKTSEQYLLSNH